MTTWWKTHITNPIINRIGERIEKRHFSKAPILIGGCPRSGTSLLLSVVSAHPNVYAFPHEVDAFTEWERSGKGKLNPVRKDRLYRYLITHKIPNDVTRWCEKRPYNVRYLNEIFEYFKSGCRFIHIVRDPRGVCTSYHPSKPNEYWVSPRKWVREVSAGLTFSGHPQVLTIKYEDLIMRNKEVVNDICNFIDESAGAKMGDWLTNATIRSNKAWFRNLSILEVSPLNKWRDPTHNQRVEEIMSSDEIRRLMKELGYLK
jgi:hypothetical protein